MARRRGMARECVGKGTRAQRRVDGREGAMRRRVLLKPRRGRRLRSTFTCGCKCLMGYAGWWKMCWNGVI